MVCKRLYIAQFLLLVALCALQLHCSSAMKIGFLGLGTINNACATGLLTCAEPPTAVTVSPRNAAKAAALAAKFPELVTVATANQEVLDACDVIFVAVLPAQAEATLGELTFKPDHKIISLMAGVAPATLQPWLKCVPIENVAQCIPLPPVKDHAGVTLVHPPSNVAGAVAMQLFNMLGTAVGAETNEAMGTLPVVACMMGAYYGTLHAMHQWMVSKGVDPKAASTYVGAQMHSIALDGKQAGDSGFEHLIAEQTPGGYNEQGLREWREAGVFEEVQATMESISSRWQGKTKGSDGRPPTSRTAAAAAPANAALNGDGTSAANTPPPLPPLASSVEGVGNGVLSAAGLELLAKDPQAFEAAIAEVKAKAAAAK